jgi:rsbT co-antagonist protein RsbR
LSTYMEEVARRIAEQKFELADRITNEQNKNHPNQQLPIANQLREQRVKLIELYEHLLTDDIPIALKKITHWGEETGAFCSELGMTVDVALDELPYYREVMAEIMLHEAETHNISFRAYHESLSKLHRIIDQAAHSFSIAFVRHHNQMLERTQAALTELSVPVVPLEEGVAVLPIIGMIDTWRAKLLMEESLKQSTKLNVSYFILDLSGTPIIDTAVAHQLFQVIKSLRLLGVTAVISGIRPEIAQTIVNIGINFENIQTYSTLKQALNAHRK